jgi:hypothetical protein
MPRKLQSCLEKLQVLKLVIMETFKSALETSKLPGKLQNSLKKVKAA